MKEKLKLLAPVGMAAVGALSMVGVYAFADTGSTASPQAPVAQTQSAAQAANGQNKGAGIETGDDNDSASVSDTDKETNDDAQAADQNDSQDPGQSDGETND